MQSNPGRSYQTRMILILAIMFGFVFFDRNAVNYLMPFMQDLHLSYTQVGMVASSLSFTWALAGLFGGAISDRTGKRKAPLLVAMIAFSLCSFMSGMATSFAMLLLARLMMGIAEGPILPISQSLVAQESSDDRRGHNMGVMQNFGSNLIGSFLAPLILVPLAISHSWRFAFYIAGIPGLVMAWFVWRYVHEPQPDAGAAKASAPGERMHPLEMLRYRNMRVCILMSVVMVAWMVLGWVFLPQYYTKARLMDPSEMKWQVSVLGISAAAFSFVVPGLSDRFGRRPVVFLFNLIGVLVPIAAVYYHGSPYILWALVFIGWSASGTFPLFMGTIPSETIPARMVATGLGLVMGLGEIVGGVFSPTLAGMAADRHGAAAPLVIMGACALVGTVLALFLKETAPRAQSPG
jgi:MFS family permease